MGDERKLSSVNGSYLQILKTYLYFLFLIVLIMFILNYFNDPYTDKSLLQQVINVFTFGDFVLAAFFFIFLLPLGATFSIHRSFSKALLVSGIFFAIWAVLIFITDTSNEKYSVLFIAMAFWYWIGSCVFALLLRSFYKIERRYLRVIILMLPFLVLLFIVFIKFIIVASVDFEYCNKLKIVDGVDGYQKNKCFETLALRENDITVCERLESYSCFEQLAVLNHDLTICNRVLEFESIVSNFRISNPFPTNSGVLSHCYVLVAMKYRDYGACDKLDEEEKSYCDIVLNSMS